MPVFMIAEHLSVPAVFERQLCGSLIVDKTGQRFVNEAIPYSDFGHECYKRHCDRYPAVPFYYIMDQRCRNKHFFYMFRPGQKIPQQYYDSGEFVKANTVRELAQLVGIDPDTLEQTITRYNGYARGMKDQEFRKGQTPFEHVYADPAMWPNPCLGPIDKPPFYAVKMYPGDLGTKGGLVTDEYARVLNKNGSVIQGLFATGYTSASVMGNAYAGPGGTIGPSMTFGYIAARYINSALK
jgi:3-oxosteroid 1-dehydrogenase